MFAISGGPTTTFTALTSLTIELCERRPDRDVDGVAGILESIETGKARFMQSPRGYSKEMEETMEMEAGEKMAPRGRNDLHHSVRCRGTAAYSSLSAVRDVAGYLHLLEVDTR